MSEVLRDNLMMRNSMIRMTTDFQSTRNWVFVLSFFSWDNWMDASSSISPLGATLSLTDEIIMSDFPPKIVGCLVQGMVAGWN